MEINRYLNRIGYKGELKPELQVLSRLQKSQLLNVPFENLDIHYGNKIILDPERFYEKIVDGKRGGFCYELNGLFYELLTEIGFNVKMISAKVFNVKENSFGPEYDHLAVIADIDGIKFLTDVGFGEFAFNPLRLEPGKVQIDERGEFLIERNSDGNFTVSKKNKSRFIPEYIFGDRERELKEFESMCYFHQTSSESHFTKDKLCSIATPNGRITLTGKSLLTRENDISKETPVYGENEFREILNKYFSINVELQILKNNL